ncbi:Gfo/Idh/MocA family oxidoreductase [Planctomycetales bacterium ZRK34]|nr:Gfo/Idh/MocA family oxidoreductase [Planctomycetales bacterium ZRK34]
MTLRQTRRTLLKQIAVAGATMPWISPRLVRAVSPNGKLRHVSFGANGMAWSDINSLSRNKNWELIAAVDVDMKRFGKLDEKFPKTTKYQDWREVFDKHVDEFDSCNVTVPDHSHAPIAMTALNHDKHVYCQKPLCHDLYEVRKLTEAAAAKPKLATQMGIQIHSSAYYRLGVALIHSGAIGKVKEVHTFSHKKWGDMSPKPDKSDPVPDNLNWDVWLGVCSKRPFIGGGYYHPGNWRKRLDFGTGTFGDMGCHIYDPVFEALALTYPLKITSRGPEPGDYNWSINSHIEYIFPGTQYTAGDTVNVTWYDGDARPPQAIQQLVEGRKVPNQGSIFIGTEGVMLLPHVERPFLYPQVKFADYKFPKVEGSDHWGQFVDAALGHGQTLAPFSYSGPLTEAVIMGGVACRFKGKTLHWDGAGLKFTNEPKANDFVRKPYREGWDVPGLTT